MLSLMPTSISRLIAIILLRETPLSLICTEYVRFNCMYEKASGFPARIVENVIGSHAANTRSPAHLQFHWMGGATTNSMVIDSLGFSKISYYQYSVQQTHKEVLHYESLACFIGGQNTPPCARLCLQLFPLLLTLLFISIL